MTRPQMVRRYPDQWLLVAYDELDESFQVQRGWVVEHSRDKQAVYAAMSSCPLPRLAVISTHRAFPRFLSLRCA